MKRFDFLAEAIEGTTYAPEFLRSKSEKDIKDMLQVIMLILGRKILYFRITYAVGF